MKNMISKTNIDWADYVWNPVWGCLNNCEYCYARKIAKRFGNKICGRDDFKPTWIQSNFIKEFPKKPSRIFVNSMSDIYYWSPKWFKMVLAKITINPQHKFLFLTKHPKVYNIERFPENCWLGVTIHEKLSPRDILDVKEISKNKVFISNEPILFSMTTWFLRYIDWVIVGAETGTRKNKINPEIEWVDNIKDSCERHKKPLFMKDNLKEVWGEDLIKQYPDDLK